MSDAARTPNGREPGPRLIAIVGPYQSGKTTLLESLLARGGALQRQGKVSDGTSLGDATPEARAHQMSVEPNIACVDYMGDRYTFVDCPGSIEFLNDMRATLAACDLAIVVCELDEKKVPMLQVILRDLEAQNIPRLLFLNKIDLATTSIRESLQMLQPASVTPLLLRQIPIWQNGISTGFIDLALERAFVYREHAPSEMIELPAGELPREKEARYSMLERLADYDDALMEELISDIEPPRDQVFDDLTKDVRSGHVVPILMGSAERGNGVTRLLKALRHESPTIAETRTRLSLAADGAPMAHVLRTMHTAHGGKLSFARVLRGSFADGTSILNSNGEEDRISGLSRLTGGSLAKVGKAEEGDTLAFGRLEHLLTGHAFTEAKTNARAPEALAMPLPPEPIHGFALVVKDRKDEVRVAAALTKLIEEDPALVFQQDAEASELRLLGQGEMHLRVALERLSARYNVNVGAKKRSMSYRETIRDTVSTRGRHKKQSGGHGQYGDVLIDVRPQARGEGFAFSETVHGGTVPKQYFGSVEDGCRDGMVRGPLGFPVVDVAVTLTDGSYHTVDSSDMAFRAAAKLAVTEALAKARPVLLEPILSVEVHVPSDALSRATAMVSGRRGQILGYDPREGWPGWDTLKALIPEAEIGDLILELRSATAGVGTYAAKFNHMAELSGRPADQVVAQRAHERAG